MADRLLPTVLAVGDPLEVAELGAAVLDGLLVPHGPAFLPVDLPAAASVRATALRPLLGRGVIVARRSAAWLWGAVWTLERPLHGYVAPARTPPPTPGATIHQVRLAEGDVTCLGDTPVTSPLRTALDLVCAPEAEFDQQAVARMLPIARLDAPALTAELERRPRLPGRLPGLRRLQVLFTR